MSPDKTIGQISYTTSSKRLINRLGRWLKRRQPSEELILFATSLLVGLGAGIGAVIFRYLIKAVEWIGYTWFPSITSNWGNELWKLLPSTVGASDQGWR
jgi:hypothetical protein